MSLLVIACGMNAALVFLELTPVDLSMSVIATVLSISSSWVFLFAFSKSNEDCPFHTKLSRSCGTLGLWQNFTPYFRHSVRPTGNTLFTICQSAHCACSNQSILLALLFCCWRDTISARIHNCSIFFLPHTKTRNLDYKQHDPYRRKSMLSQPSHQAYR